MTAGIKVAYPVPSQGVLTTEASGGARSCAALGMWPNTDAPPGGQATRGMVKKRLASTETGTWVVMRWARS